MALFDTLVIGFSHLNSGQNEEAIEEYDKALKINPNYDVLTMPKVFLFLGLIKTKRLLKSMTKALNINPNGNALILKGFSLSKLGKDERLLKSMTRP